MSVNLGFNVSYAALNDWLAEKNGPRLSALLDGRVFLGDGHSKELKAFLQSMKPDYIISPIWFWVDEPSLNGYLPAIRKYASKAKVVAIHDDAHAVREKALMDAETNPRERKYLEKRLALINNQLKYVYNAASMNCFITEEDMAATQLVLPKGQSIQQPMLLRASMPNAKQASATCTDTPFESRSGYVFVGHGENPTNYYSMQWFLGEVWPKIRSLHKTAKVCPFLFFQARLIMTY